MDMLCCCVLALLEKLSKYQGSVLKKFVIPNGPEFRREILRSLHRMNINRAALFPGLDGFAQSLKIRLAFAPILEPDPNWPSRVERS